MTIPLGDVPLDGIRRRRPQAVVDDEYQALMLVFTHHIAACPTCPKLDEIEAWRAGGGALNGMVSLDQRFCEQGSKWALMLGIVTVERSGWEHA